MCSVSETYAGGFETGVSVGNEFTVPLMLGFKKPNKGHFLNQILHSNYSKPIVKVTWKLTTVVMHLKILHSTVV
jgi:hypothetical protein